jgi:4-hydroxy-3-methylbut-2-en-1-yl diphosphate reductase
VHENAGRRHLKVVDATCPLVTKVHVEAQRFAKGGRTIFLIGHAGHEEIEGTAGEAPDRIVVVEGPGDVANVAAADPERVAYLTQTTLAVDDTVEVVEALRQRFPAMVGPKHDDICYASQNRQEAVKALAARSDLVFIVGSQNSSNSNRLVEVAREAGTVAYLISDETSIDPDWITEAEVIGLSSGASTPDVLVERVVAFLHDRGYGDVEEVTVATEDVHFPLPAGLD